MTPEVSDKVCSGNGTCECSALPYGSEVFVQSSGFVSKRKFDKIENFCVCNPGFFGQFCESSSPDIDSSPLCVHYAPYVRCKAVERLKMENETCSLNVDAYKYEFLEEIPGELSF